MFPGSRYVALWILTGTTMFFACSTNNTGTNPIPHPHIEAPAASSPTQTVESLRWSWEHTSFDPYRALFTSDYVFQFAVLDSSASASSWTRDDELQSFTHLVSGGGVATAASSITLTFGSIVVGPDPRPGKSDPERYRLVSGSCALMVQTSDGSATSVSGRFRLFVVRGDVAHVPADLGRSADAGLWYVERWEDQTGSITGTTGAQSAPSPTWGALKARYREAAASAARP